MRWTIIRQWQIYGVAWVDLIVSGLKNTVPYSIFQVNFRCLLGLQNFEIKGDQGSGGWPLS